MQEPSGDAEQQGPEAEYGGDYPEWPDKRKKEHPEASELNCHPEPEYPTG